MTANATPLRNLPHDLEAEMRCLGGMLTRPSAIADVRAVIGPWCHYRPAHQIVHEAILRLDDAGEPVDAVTVADHLRQRGELGKAGGPDHLHDLLASVPVAENAAWYARIVRRHWVSRNAIERGMRITQAGYESAAEPEELAEFARTEADAILPAPAAGGVQDTESLFYDVLGQLESGTERGLPTPWADINRAVPGLAPGELVVIGASSGTGKSIAGLNLCAYLALDQGIPALIATMEMTRHEVMLRLISAEAGVPLDSLTRRHLTDDDWARIKHVADRITAAPLVIDDSPGMSVAGIRSRLREMARTQPAGIVFVDYLALLSEPDGAENRQTAVGGNARSLKHIAGEFGIPVVAAAQLNREMERRHDKRPQPSDLRDSAEIEHAASVIILLYREDVHGEETARAGEIDFIVGKNRNGQPCTVSLLFQGPFARCVDSAANWTAHSSLEKTR
ncbi:MAG: replicative DNA helicase [Actinobacteria bacterium]|nr:replicative DNA helicase [Actinomycetota bacterium]